MELQRKVTIAVAWFNLVAKQKTNAQQIDAFLKNKTEQELNNIANYLKANFTTEEMLQTAELFSEEVL